MISVTELRPGVAFEEDGQILKVLSYEHTKLGRGSASIKVRVKNLRSGSVTDKSFINGAKVKEVDIIKKKYQYLYKDSDSAYFMDEVTYEQIQIPLAKFGSEAEYLKEGLIFPILIVGDEPLNIELPPKMEFSIAETGPNVKGNSATNIFKDAILDNGLKVRVPLFANVGDRVLVDTRTGEYSERLNKST